MSDLASWLDPNKDEYVQQVAYSGVPRILWPVVARAHLLARPWLLPDPNPFPRFHLWGHG